MVDVAGAFLSAFLQVLFDRIATRRLWDFLRRNNIDEAMLDDLNTQLLSVNALLVDAEEKQFADPCMKNWVDKLREAVYDADDVLDHIATTVFQSKVSYSLPSLNPFIESMKSKLEGINSRLKSIAERRDLLRLEGGGKISSLSMPTTCLITELEVYGRDDDRNYIVDLLSSFSNGSEEGVSVIAIVGMAGIGKTTLSQIVYKDPRVESHFDVGSWVYISDGSNVFEVTKKIFDSLTCSCSEIRDLNTLQMKLESKLRRKRFLLVLDDYWAEDFLDWDLLKRPLTSGLRGSSILVTTRNESVALTMHATKIYRLPPLSDEDSWSLFSHRAFCSGVAEDNPTIIELGKQIVRKCKGHPLAVKTFGSLLTFKTEAKDWNNIMQSKVWDLPAHKSNILPALRLSYRHLPEHLKRCFAYCSIFPKGYEGNKRNLIHLWMAEGFLPLPKNERAIEDVGEEYFHELSSRSFLQSNDSSFTMHDLMIDLAQHIGGEFFYKWERNEPRQDPGKVRHLTIFLDEVGVEKIEPFLNLSPLRTFLSLRSTYSGRSCPIEGHLNLLLCERRCLRVLSLSNYPITHLPKSIIHLEHLRYLNLSHTLIEQLPESVGSLYNLQTLLLSNCRYLTVLPTSMRNLINLHHLDISGTALSEMPPQFRKLEHLQLLTNFVGSGAGSKISELGALLKLSGALSIEKLEYVNLEDASGAKIKEKKFLDHLELKWSECIPHNFMKEVEVLSHLEPHTILKCLKIENFGGILFPDWLGSSSFFNMVSVHLVSCESCSSLPPLGQLPSLKTLHIENMISITVVNSAFFGNSTSPFNSLINLTFVNMSGWEQWQLDEGNRCFPSLQVFHIRECPRLSGSLPRVPVLQELELHGCKALASLSEEMMQDNACLRKLVICNCPSLTSFPDERMHLTLESLHISECRNLGLFFDENNTWHYQALKHLHVENSCCDILTSFPLSMSTALHDLHILHCQNLVSLSLLPELNLPNLSDIVIKGCHNLVLLPEQGFPNSLASLNISDCPLLVPLCRRDTGSYWQLVSGLQQLVIDEEVIISHTNAEP